MYQSGFYSNQSRDAVARAIRAEGFDPLLITDPPGHLYPPHAHPEKKLLAFLGGSMTVRVRGETVECAPGDRLVIPGNEEHSARVGPDGCDFFWSEKLERSP